MRLSNVLLFSSVANTAVSFPPRDIRGFKHDRVLFDLEGYAKDNALGPTTGGEDGDILFVSTSKDLLDAVQGNEPAAVYVQGTVELSSRAKLGSNKSLVGVGEDAQIIKNGLTVEDQDNVVIRNLKISNIVGQDGISVNNSTRVWIDHNEFESELSLEVGPDTYDGQIDIAHASDWITVSWNYFHDHWKSSLVGNSDANRDEDSGRLHVTYHHNRWQRAGTRGPAGRFGHQHVYNNVYEDFLYQAIHSRSDNQVLVEGNVFRGNTSEALSTYGLVIPNDSPNTCTCGDEELDGYANLGADNDWGGASINITQVGDFETAGYEYELTPLESVEAIVLDGAGVGKIN